MNLFKKIFTKKKRRNDFLLGLFFVILAAGMILFNLNGRTETGMTGKTVEVYVGGKRLVSYPLNKNGEYEIVGLHLGKNTLVIKNEEAYISSASCPDGLCVKHGKIRRTGETLVCLPNGLVVKIVSDDGTEEFDGISE